MEIDDRELVRRVLAGETDAIRVLVDRHQQSVYRFASGLVGNREEAVAFEENSGRRYLVAYGDSKDGDHKQGDFDATIPEHHAFVLGDNRDRAKG